MAFDPSYCELKLLDIIECQGCKTPSVRLATGHPKAIDEPITNEEVQELRSILEYVGDEDGSFEYFPAPKLDQRERPEWLSELPIKLKSIWEEVYAALGCGAPRLATMGVRAALDIYLTKRAGHGSFKERLEKLVATSEISLRDKRVLAVAIDAGSAAAHRGHAPSWGDLAGTMDIAENLFQKAYVLPSKARRIRAGTPRRPLRRPRTRLKSASNKKLH